MVRVFVVDDSMVYRSGNKRFINTLKDCEVVETAISAEDALNKIDNQRLEFDLLVSDYDMGGVNKDGSYLIQGILERYKTNQMPLPHIIVASSHSKEELQEGFAEVFSDVSGFEGNRFCLKNGDTLFHFCHKEQQLNASLAAKIEELTISDYALSETSEHTKVDDIDPDRSDKYNEQDLLIEEVPDEENLHSGESLQTVVEEQDLQREGSAQTIVHENEENAQTHIIRQETSLSDEYPDTIIKAAGCIESFCRLVSNRLGR